MENKVTSMHSRLKDALFEEIDELFIYANDYFADYLLGLLDEFIEKEQIPEPIAAKMIPHFLWWAILTYRSPKNRKTIFQHYLESPEYKSRRKPYLHKNVSQWKYVLPSFYYVEEILGDRALVLIDIFQMKEKLVGVFNEVYHPPSERQMVFGYILPDGDGTYSPIIDFFHIPSEHKQEVAIQIIQFYNKKAVTTDRQFFEKYFPKLLSIISKIIDKQN
ncbi:hypothetical protein [Bacillus sp. REN3]|uniref:hypothetical protein n=1 Tax=Bacillus sp. REN3 TaxID=2802440 RepID=UPI001AEE7031|nr:hypothetical protein [Bacillus sp. REN3]